MKRLFKYLKPDFKTAFFGVVFVGSVALIELYQIQLMGEIIDVGIANADMGLIFRVGLVMIGLALLGAVIAVLGLVLPATATTRFANRLRNDMFKRIQQFSIKNVSRFQTASLVTRLTNDIDFLQRTLLMSLRLLVRAPVLLISTVSMTYATSAKVARVPMVAVVILSFVMLFIIQQGFSRFVFLQQKLDSLNQKIQESLMNIRVIKSFVREPVEDIRFKDENDAYYNASYRAHSLMLLLDPSLMAAINFATIFVIYLSSSLIIDTKEIAIGDLLVFVNYLRFTMFSMMMITNVFMMMTRSKASIQRLNAIFDTEIDITSPTHPMVIEDVRGHISFNNVTFKYFDDEDVKNTLESINFDIKPGEKIGIIGSTGSGKSTLVNLLGRLIDVNSGSITIDGVDIRDLDIKALRAIFGFVPQKNVLFSGTIADNLRLGDENASIEVLDKATRAANIHDFIMQLENGYEATVQQGGSNFSGGQKQRLCIARALAINPKVLILDDSTSALDAQTEKKVMASLSNDYADITIISIAQKISSVSSMDRIVVLNEGVIVGLDNHENLMRDCTVYQEIYQSQMRNGDTVKEVQA